MAMYRFYITQINEYTVDIDADNIDHAELLFEDYITDDFVIESSVLQVDNVVELATN